MSGSDRRARLQAARLYLVVEADAARRVVPDALAGGVDVVQLREKEAPDGEIVAAGRALRALCDERGALLVVNDRADLALACDADGVHVGQDDEPVESVRRAVGRDVLVGLSTHTPAQVDAGEASGADYLGVGPVYETTTKPGAAAVGLELVEHAARSVRKPWFAIGGIDAQNIGEVVTAGARRAVVVRAIRDADDPRAVASALKSSLSVE